MPLLWASATDRSSVAVEEPNVGRDFHASLEEDVQLVEARDALDSTAVVIPSWLRDLAIHLGLPHLRGKDVERFRQSPGGIRGGDPRTL